MRGRNHGRAGVWSNLFDAFPLCYMAAVELGLFVMCVWGGGLADGLPDFGDVDAVSIWMSMVVASVSLLVLVVPSLVFAAFRSSRSLRVLHVVVVVVRVLSLVSCAVSVVWLHGSRYLAAAVGGLLLPLLAADVTWHGASRLGVRGPSRRRGGGSSGD